MMNKKLILRVPTLTITLETNGQDLSVTLRWDLGWEHFSFCLSARGLLFCFALPVPRCGCNLVEFYSVRGNLSSLLNRISKNKRSYAGRHSLCSTLTSNNSSISTLLRWQRVISRPSKFTSALKRTTSAPGKWRFKVIKCFFFFSSKSTSPQQETYPSQ